MAFAGIGAAVGGGLTANQGWDISLALLVGGCAGALIAVIIGYPAIRRGGLTLAVITLAFALLTSSYLLNEEFFNSWLPVGRIARTDLLGLIDISTETRYYYFCLACLALMYFLALGVRRSRTGRVLIAIRENERAARSYGVSATRTTLAAFAMSGFMAAFAGVLYVHHQSGLGVAAFLPYESLTAFSMVVIGGLGSSVRRAHRRVSRAGAVLPARQLGSSASGAGLLLVLMILPGGIGADRGCS
jgi:branched-chain amino acid transport system permease protein